MSTEEIELEGLEYMYKFKERLDIAMTYISDGRDISEEDYQVLFEVFKIQSEGRLPFFKTTATESPVTTTQADLFSSNTFTFYDNPSESVMSVTTGTIVEPFIDEQKNITKNGNKKV